MAQQQQRYTCQVLRARCCDLRGQSHGFGAAGADTAGRFPGVVWLAEGEGVRMWHDVLVEQITLAERVIRTIEDSG